MISTTLAAFLLNGCLSTIDPYAEEVTSIDLFQNAYEATEAGRYALAISYYEAIQERFPDDVRGNLWASFEIAFLYHKMGKNEEALKRFEDLLTRYEGEEGNLLPQAPRILAEKVTEEIRSS